MAKESNLQRNPKKRSEMSDKERVQDFQRKLYRKAKQEKELRFWILYDKVRLRHFLREAYRRVKANGGSPGVDGITFEDIEKEGLDKFLKAICEELETKTYKPQAVKRVMIPKPNGKMRPLGIPTIKDRVVQMSCKMVIEPIFEADFEDTSYGFRPKRSVATAISKIKTHLMEGKAEVYDADLSSFFDTIPHDKLLKLISMRISDKNILHLIKLWLKAPISEDNKISGGKKNKKGTPQGGVISPLLANIYLHLVDKAVNKESGIFKNFGVVIVRYADDFVLMSKQIPDKVLEKLHNILTRMELTINEEKSSIISAQTDPFDFLGFTIRYDKDLYGRNKRYWNIVPSEKSMKKIRKTISDELKKVGHYTPEALVRKLNEIIRGWVIQKTIKGVTYPADAKRKLRWHLMKRLTRYYKRKSQRKCKLYGKRAFEVLVDKYGLIDPCKYKFKGACENF